MYANSTKGACPVSFGQTSGLLYYPISQAPVDQVLDKLSTLGQVMQLVLGVTFPAEQAGSAT